MPMLTTLKAAAANAERQADRLLADPEADRQTIGAAVVNLVALWRQERQARQVAVTRWAAHHGRQACPFL